MNPIGVEVKVKLSQQEYVEADGSACPVCGGDNLEWGEITVGDNQVWQEVSCADCDAEWHDMYNLTGYELLTGGVGIQ